MGTLVRQWLLTNCGVGVDAAPALELRQLGERVVAELINAFDDGPEPSMLRSIEQAANERFERRGALLARATGLGLDAADLHRARRMTRAEYVVQARADFVHQYRAEALRALGVVGGAQARILLQRIAAEPDSPFSATARYALRELQ